MIYFLSVYGCTSRTIDFPGDFYCFPKNPSRFAAWVEACARPPDPAEGLDQDGKWTPNTAARVCSIHFTVEALMDRTDPQVWSLSSFEGSRKL